MSTTPEREPALPPKAPDSGKDPMQHDAPPRPKGQQTRGTAGRKQLTVWMDADLHKRMQRLKVEEGDNLQEQIEAAVTRYLEQRGY